MNASSRYVFVYGTLRRGEVRDINLLRPAPVWVGRGRVAGVLYDLGSYPGLQLASPETTQAPNTPGSYVEGEIYSIAQDLERQLDAIEEVWPQQTGEYARREVPVLLVQDAPDGSDALTKADLTPRALVCLLYEISADRVQGKPRIGCGDWVNRGRPRS